ncbi:KR domain-containing protein [Paracoccus yeei]|uniref:KR domain-containing protein n=2 Tax=Paracoccus yeei TaxID=147645 RepID=A0A1V0GSB1_9RHOB|nr:KR domain-containing protein [Paracoccus yeei]
MTGTMLVTGGSRGIGRAVALMAAERGWDIALNWRGDRAAAEETAARIRDLGRRVVVSQGDVSVEADVIRVFDEAEAAFGRLDAVVVNAGIAAPAMRLAEMGLDRIERVIRVNVTGALLTCREAARRMGRTGEPTASITIIGSAASRLGGGGQYVDYAASKAAVEALTNGLSKELAGDGIRVNLIRPGLIETDIHAEIGDPDRPRKLARSVPMSRPGSADEVAEGVVWLASPQAGYVTGAILDIAGGR